MTKSPEPTKVRGDFQLARDQYSERSTSVEDQLHRIVRELRLGPKTTNELRRIGCQQVAARVKELRDKHGYSIRTERASIHDENGYLHINAARYHLVAEPEADFVPKSSVGAAAALRNAAKGLRAQAKGLECNSIKVKHIPDARKLLIDALRALDALERAEVAGDAGTNV